MNEINYLLILVSGFAAISSPGPATLAIAGTSMGHGRRQGLSLACGVLTGSIFWSISAAFGLAAILHSNVWLFEVLRYFGAVYLLYLAFRSLQSACSKNKLVLPSSQINSIRKNYFKGLLIHLTNPKAILFFASLYSLGVPSSAKPFELVSVIVSVGVLSGFIFLGYAILFSSAAASNVYLKSKVAFETIFAIFFGIASARLLVSDLGK